MNIKLFKVESNEYRTIYKRTESIGDLEILFEGEHFKGDTHGILDTKVTINGKMLCWVTWREKDEFLKKLNDVIEEHRI